MTEMWPIRKLRRIYVYFLEPLLL